MKLLVRRFKTSLNLCAVTTTMSVQDHMGPRPYFEQLITEKNKNYGTADVCKQNKIHYA